MLNRRRWLQGLGLAGSSIVLCAQAARQGQTSAARAGLRLGVVALPGSPMEDFARRCAPRLGQSLGERVLLQVMPPGTDTLAWCSRDAQTTGLLLAEVWRLGAQASWHSNEASAAACLAAAPPLALLAQEPLVLAVNRFMPRTLAEFCAEEQSGSADAARSDRWRYGVDGADPVAAEVAAACLQQAGLDRLRQVVFRGPSQLLPALAGARLQMTAQRIADTLAGQDCGTADDRGAGNHGGWAAAHRAGDVHLLAVADSVRLSMLPEVPTLNEALGGSGHEAARCRVLLATPSTSTRRLQRLADAAASLVGSC